MIEKLIEIISNTWSTATPVFILNQYEEAVVLRGGRKNRKLSVGIHWKIPVLEELISTSIALRTIQLPTQTLTTSDNKTIVVTTVIKCTVQDVEPYTLLLEDQDGFIIDAGSMSVKTIITRNTFDEGKTVEAKIKANLISVVKEYGIVIHTVGFQTYAQMKSIRVILDSKSLGLD